MNLNRRSFLKLAGIGSVSMAGACASETEKTLYSLVQAPDDMVTGKEAWYASTCRECPAGCGILAKNREGRVIKLEGNPLHPVNRGALCIRGQAALQGAYNPDRIRTPLLKEKSLRREISFSEAESILRRRTKEAAGRGENRVRMISEVVGESLSSLFTETLRSFGAPPPLLFEPYAYESLKKSNALVFGAEGLPSYRMEQADVVVSFGADFLETWLSPVEYAGKLKAMHGYRNGGKGAFLYVSPHRSLTGVNADLWLPCRPGSECAVALGCLKEALKAGRGRQLPEDVRHAAEQISSPYAKAEVLLKSGLSEDRFDAMTGRILKAENPLLLGTGSGPSGPNSLQTDTAVNLLNLVLDPALSLIDFQNRHRVETAVGRSDLFAFLDAIDSEPADLLLLNNVNPVYAIPSKAEIASLLKKDSLFVVSFSSFMDETTELADLVIPTRLPLESWDEYGGYRGLLSTLQPASGGSAGAPSIGDLLVSASLEDKEPAQDYKTYLVRRLSRKGLVPNERSWVETLRDGGRFKPAVQSDSRPVSPNPASMDTVSRMFRSLEDFGPAESLFIAAPSVRYLDGRGANKPWLSEIPDPITKVAWQIPVRMHPETLRRKNIAHEDVVRLGSAYGRIEAVVYEYEGVVPGVAVMEIGHGHNGYGRYAEAPGVNPFLLLSPEPDPFSGGPRFFVESLSIETAGRSIPLASTAGSRIQHGRKIALAVDLSDLEKKISAKPGLTMNDFPLTLPLPEGYDRKRDVYPPLEHSEYRWSMVVDLDRCTGCAACAAACYAENNLGVVGVGRVIEGREMAWLSIERYHNPDRMEDIMFLPMLCQHCNSGPCESVCPVYAPHHSKEGINNQIYNRCIGTRFCSQNCPYKVRRFNWYAWKWPHPLDLQLNPDVTVRSKGVMEKCSFCIQRIKAVRTAAKNENRRIRDGEVTPACVQTCPTGALAFGNLLDKQSRVRKLVDDPRAYQVMGYLNTKPAVIYLKKVVQKI
jgi:molybdopterin-containing oxidoreductase family iron-sulfur binding subunit